MFNAIKIAMLFFCMFLFVSNASAQKITGKYWLFTGYSSLEPDESGYVSKVGDMFQGSKFYFDKDGDLEIYFQDGKTYLFGYEWKSDTKVLMLNFTGKDDKDPNIKFLKYYSYLCESNNYGGDEFLSLSFLEPSKSGIIDYKAKPKFSLSFRKK